MAIASALLTDFSGSIGQGASQLAQTWPEILKIPA